MENNDYVVKTAHGEVRVIPYRAYDRNGIRYMNASDTIIGVIRMEKGIPCVVLRPPYMTPARFLDHVEIGLQDVAAIPYQRIVEAERIAQIQ
mgnify:CR=1 FL=1